jgi:hypothetical protein
LRPYIAYVSNQYTSAGEFLEQTAAEFSLFIVQLTDSDGGGIYQAPLLMCQEELDALIQRTAALESVGSPDAVLQTLVDKLHEVADRVDSVGHSVMLNVLPKGAVERPTDLTIAGPPASDVATFLYLPGDSAATMTTRSHVTRPSRARVA